MGNLFLRAVTFWCLGLGSLWALDEGRFGALSPWYSVGPEARMGEFHARAYLSLAVELQALGPAEAGRLLRQWSEREDGVKVIPLCRMLFVAREGGSFRGPKLGWGNSCPREDKADWPLEPIALVDQIPFLVCPRYARLEKVETGREYVDYCLSECDWGKHRFVMPAEEAFVEAQRKLSGLVGGTRKGVWSLYFKQQILVKE